MSSSLGRPMQFRYTSRSEIAHFPMKFYVQNQWIWKYRAIVIVLVFYKIIKLANSSGDADISKWAEIRRKEAAEHH